MAGTDAQEWQGRVGKSWAAEWRRTDRSFRNLTPELIRRAEAQPFAAAIDIGCGAGEVSISLAKSRPDARVTGLDISPDLVAAAKARGADITNLRFELADAAQWQPESGFAPDLLVSRHGVMFFDDPIGAFAHLHSVAALGARLVFSCFRTPLENPFFLEVGKLLPLTGEAPDPFAPGPFAFADAARVSAILSQAGWCNVACEPFDFRMVAGSGEDPVADGVGYFSRIGPAARAISEMGDAERAAFKAKLAAFALEHLAGGEVGLDAGVWLVSASRD